MTDNPKTEVEYWSRQAMMWHDKYKAVLAQEDEYHRFKVALERIWNAKQSGVTKERLRLIAKYALGIEGV